MAALSSDCDISSNVDKEETELVVNYFNQRPVPYAFEPVVSESQLSNNNNREDSSSDRL